MACSSEFPVGIKTPRKDCCSTRRDFKVHRRSDDPIWFRTIRPKHPRFARNACLAASLTPRGRMGGDDSHWDHPGGANMKLNLLVTTAAAALLASGSVWAQTPAPGQKQDEKAQMHEQKGAAAAKQNRGEEKQAGKERSDAAKSAQ